MERVGATRRRAALGTNVAGASADLQDVVALVVRTRFRPVEHVVHLSHDRR